jgi:dTDP-4-amino-4,6-dideoxygalactose transaminase
MKVKFNDLAAYHRHFSAEFHSALDLILKDSEFILGRHLEDFERRLSDYVGTTYAIGVSTGLSALSLAIRASSLPRGSEVILPVNSFVASAHAIVDNGLKPRFVDISAHDMLIDPQAVKGAITANTSAILPVHLHGRIAPMIEIQEIAKKHQLVIIEDAAQAIGAEYQGRRAGSWGLAAGFSFYPGKNLGALGDGGAITTSERSIFESSKLYRNYGSRTKYEHLVAAGNERLDSLQALFLKVKLSKLEENIKIRRSIARRYLEEIENCNIALPMADTDISRSAWHNFVLRSSARQQLQNHLLEKGIETIIHYPKVITAQPCYSHFKLICSTPVATEVSSQVLSLPIHPSLTDAEVSYIIEVLNDFKA